MDKRTTSSLSSGYPDTEINMEGDTVGGRWAIPRPSLTCSVSSIESGSRKARGKSPTKSRGSASSQGSTSNHSTHSASSGSLLLSAANLSKLNATTATATTTAAVHSSTGNYQNNLNAYVVDIDEKQQNAELSTNNHHHADPFWRNVKIGGKPTSTDGESVASSTHFTVVNGFTRHGAKPRANDTTACCCKSSHQITVLVVTMTILFTAGILAAICYIEMRQRRDVGWRYS